MQVNVERVLARDEFTDEVFVAFGVLERVYQLIKDQKRYFKTRDKLLQQDCKRREDAFLQYFELLQKAVQQDEVLREKKIQKFQETLEKGL